MNTVLITGASQGIGRATALLFAKKGDRLVLAARQAERLQAFAEELQTSGYNALAVPTDVKDSEQVEHLVKTAIGHYGAIDVLINNAGIYISGPVEEFSLADWHQVIDTNLWGYIHMIHALLPHFLMQQSGTIINVCSIGGKTPIPYLTPYTTSKFAITGLTQALHAELAPKGVHVGGVYPNLIKSNFLERAIFRGKNAEDTASRRQQVEQLFTVPLVEKPEDVAKAIWNAVNQRQTEVLVGSANLANLASQLLPGVMQKIMRKTFEHQDK
jgi:short-subunit dehydrogenase